MVFVVLSSVGVEGIVLRISLYSLVPDKSASSILSTSKLIFSPVRASAVEICACNKSLLNCVISALNATIISLSWSKFIYSPLVLTKYSCELLPP